MSHSHMSKSTHYSTHRHTHTERKRDSLHPLSHLQHFSFLLKVEQVGHLPCIEQPVHVLQEGLLLDLGVGQQEHRLLALLTGTLQ